MKNLMKILPMYVLALLLNLVWGLSYNSFKIQVTPADDLHPVAVGGLKPASFDFLSVEDGKFIKRDLQASLYFQFGPPPLNTPGKFSVLYFGTDRVTSSGYLTTTANTIPAQLLPLDVPQNGASGTEITLDWTTKEFTSHIIPTMTVDDQTQELTLLWCEEGIFLVAKQYDITEAKGCNSVNFYSTKLH